MHCTIGRLQRVPIPAESAYDSSRIESLRLPDLPDPSLASNLPAPGQPIDELALAEIKSAILTKLRLAIGKDAGMATRHDWYKAAALALRDRIVHRWLTA